MVGTYKGLLQISGHIVWQTIQQYVLHTDIGRQDVAVSNYRVQVIRVINRICFPATIEHGTGSSAESKTRNQTLPQTPMPWQQNT